MTHESVKSDNTQKDGMNRSGHLRVGEDRGKMSRKMLIEKIKVAFDKVSLEDGIGILESDAIDSCVSDKNRLAGRNSDFRNDWQDIPDKVISEHYSALCFMDIKGLRFNLPAYMIFALRNYESSSSGSIDAVIYALCKEPEEVENGWQAFSKEQKQAIASFLKFMVVVAGEQRVDSWQASLAYEKTWAKYDTDDDVFSS
jgi:hypothetical protein